MTPDLVQAIRALLGVTRGMNLDAVLVGALVAELAAPEDEGLPAPRGTNDADFAVRLSGWGEFARVKQALAAAGFSPAPKVEHRLHWGTAIVDLIPFGPEIARGGEIVWPVSERPMVVLGFEEACAQVVESQVGQELRVRRLTIPGFVLLKIMAFLDRRAAGHDKHRSDAEDLVYWLRNYASGRQEPRRYEILGQKLGGVDYVCAGAALLGMDVGRLASPEAARRVMDFLQAAIDPYGLLANAVVSPAFDEDRGRVTVYVDAFKLGFESAQASRSP